MRYYAVQVKQSNHVFAKMVFFCDHFRRASDAIRTAKSLAKTYPNAAIDVLIERNFRPGFIGSDWEGFKVIQ